MSTVRLCRIAPEIAEVTRQTAIIVAKRRARDHYRDSNNCKTHTAELTVNGSAGRHRICKRSAFTIGSGSKMTLATQITNGAAGGTVRSPAAPRRSGPWTIAAS